MDVMQACSAPLVMESTCCTAVGLLLLRELIPGASRYHYSRISSPKAALIRFPCSIIHLLKLQSQ